MALMSKTITLLSFALFFACASADVIRLRSDVPAKPENCELEVFADEAKVKRAYEDLCVIDAKPGNTRFSDQSMTGALNNAKAAACSCGADAIIISGYDAGRHTLVEEKQARVKVKAIRFTGGKSKR